MTVAEQHEEATLVTTVVIDLVRGVPIIETGGQRPQVVVLQTEVDPRGKVSLQKFRDCRNAICGDRVVLKLRASTLSALANRSARVENADTESAEVARASRCRWNGDQCRRGARTISEAAVWTKAEKLIDEDP